MSRSIFAPRIRRRNHCALPSGNRGTARASDDGMGLLIDHVGADHDHIEQRLAALPRLFETGDLQTGQELTSLLASDLMEHLISEENDIFPKLRKRLSMAPRIDSLVREHRAIVARLGDLREAVADGELVTARKAAEDLLALIEAHHRHEMKDLYSWAEAA